MVRRVQQTPPETAQIKTREIPWNNSSKGKHSIAELVIEPEPIGQ